MSLTPVCRDAGVGEVVFPLLLKQSALIESAYSSTGDVATDCTIALGFKPTVVDTGYVLSDPTAHYLLTVRKVNDVITVWRQGEEVATLSYSAVGGSTYAALLMNVLTTLVGSYHGYYSRLQVIESAQDYSLFWQPSDVVTGLWVPIEVVVPTTFVGADTNGFTGGTAGGSNYNPSYPPSLAFDGGWTAPESSGNSVVLSSGYNALTITYDLGEGNEKVFHSIGMRCAIIDGTNGATAHAPKTFTIQGSNDNSTWDTLVSVTSAPWVSEGEELTWAPSSESPYRYYKWDITSAADGNNYVYLGECVGYEAVEQTYGAGGAFLDFADGESLGLDVSGNGNDFSIVGTATVDTPTNTFATLTSLNPMSNFPWGLCELSSGNLTAVGSLSGWAGATGTHGLMAGKWAWKVTVDSVGPNEGWACGVVDEQYDYSSGFHRRLYRTGQISYNDATSGTYGVALADGDEIEVLLDLDLGELEFIVNDSSQGVFATDLVTAMPWNGWFPMVFLNNTAQATIDFGQLGYVAPSGYRTICTRNLDDPTILKSSSFVDVITREGLTLTDISSPSYAIGSTLHAGSHANAFDNDTSTVADMDGYDSSVYVTAWLGQSFPSAVRVQRIDLTQGYPGSTNDHYTTGSVYVDCSDDGFATYTRLGPFTVSDLPTASGVTSTIYTGYDGEHTAWRLYIAEACGINYGGEWFVRNIEMYSDIESAIALPDMEGGPDVINIKDKTAGNSWHMVNSLTGKESVLFTNSNSAEYTGGDVFSAVGGGQYSLFPGSGVDVSGNSYLDCCLKADALTEFDENNNVVSHVDHGTSVGLQVVKFKGDGTAGRAIPHVHEKAPTFILLKCLSSAYNWIVYHVQLGAGQLLQLDITSSVVENAAYWPTAPDATYFYPGALPQQMGVLKTTLHTCSPTQTSSKHSVIDATGLSMGHL